MADAIQPQKGWFELLLENPKTKAWVEWFKELWAKIKAKPLLCLLTGFVVGILVFGFLIRRNILFKSWVNRLTERSQQAAGRLDRGLPTQTDVKISAVTEELERWQNDNGNKEMGYLTRT